VDISHNTVDEELDSFVLIATDGLFDVMTSQEIVSVVHEILAIATLEGRESVRRDMAKFVGDEALERGSLDNITVIIIWL
jgi:serine/threonine protein phosphatase PrpC